MKKSFLFILAFLCVFTLCSCGKNTDKEPEVIFEVPPKLTVVCGESSVEALRGTSSWSYKNPDGTSTTVMSDSMHPLCAKEYMTPLKLLPTYKSSVDPFRAYLLFEADPDKVEVRCWDESAWGKLDSEYKTIEIEAYDSEMADRAGRKDFCLHLEDGAYIYEVIAEWTENKGYGGKAHYSFYTASPNMTVYPIDNSQKQ